MTSSLPLVPPAASPLLATVGDEYPFRSIQGREPQEKVLRRWLTGGVDHPYRPRGGAALVTGFRGVGKTSLVRKVLFDVGFASLYQATFAESSTEAEMEGLWGPFVPVGLPKTSSQRRPKDGATLYVPVFVEVANPLTASALLGRVLRRTYFTLADYGIGDLAPDLMRRARLNYVRSLGEFSLETSERVQGALGVSLDRLGKLEVTAEQEYEFSETFRLISRDISVEEAEDEAVVLGSLLHRDRLGAANSPVGQLVSSGRRWRAGLAELYERLKGKKGYRVHLVYVFDETDKLPGVEVEHRAMGPEKDGESRFRIVFSDHPLRPLEATGLSLSGTVETPRRVDQRLSVLQAGSDQLRSAVEVAHRLKLLFSTAELSSIVVGGQALEAQWHREQGDHDPLLSSLFARHIYVPQLDVEQVRELLGVRSLEGLDIDDSARFLALRSRGRPKEILRRLEDLEDAHELDRFMGKLVKRIGDWGSAALPAQRPAAELPRAIERAETLEALAVLLGATLPLSRATAYGMDYVRSVLASAFIELTDNAKLQLLNRVAGRVATRHREHVPVEFMKLALLRIGAWMHELLNPVPGEGGEGEGGDLS